MPGATVRGSLCAVACRKNQLKWSLSLSAFAASSRGKGLVRLWRNCQYKS